MIALKKVKYILITKNKPKISACISKARLENPIIYKVFIQ